VIAGLFMHLDTESVRLLVTVGIMFLVGIPAITRKVWLPRNLQCEEVPREKLTPRQAAFFDAYDKEMAEIAYFPLSTFRVINLKGTNLNRAYISSSDPARCLVTMMSTGGSFTSCLEIVTRYADGTRLSTKNTQLSSVLATMPNRIVQQFPGIQDVAELKRRHDRKAEKLLSRSPEFRPPSSYFSDLDEYHQQFCQYQESNRLLRFDNAAGLYRATYRTGLRGVFNFINPLADNFTVPRFILGALLGAGLPLIAATQHARILSWLSSFGASNLVLAGSLLTPVACTLAAIAVGSIFTNKAFIWALVLGFLPAKLLALTTALSLGSGFYMAVVAHWAARFCISRRKLV
jgi:hypothetical protein